MAAAGVASGVVGLELWLQKAPPPPGGASHEARGGDRPHICSPTASQVHQTRRKCDT